LSERKKPTLCTKIRVHGMNTHILLHGLVFACWLARLPACARTTALPSLTLPEGGANLAGIFACSLNVLGGETVSTGIVKLKRHAEVVAPLVKHVTKQQLPTLNWPSLLN